MKYITTIKQSGNNTGIEVPPEIIESLGAGKKPPVKVTLEGGYTYRSTVAVMGGAFMISFSSDHRKASGIKGGDTLEVDLELDTEPRIVEVPADLAAALAAIPGAREKFDALATSSRKEFVRQVEEAKSQETRDRRVATIATKVSEGKNR